MISPILSNIPTLKTIGSKIIASMVLITTSIVVLAISFYVIYSQVLQDTKIVSQSDIPSALLSISMIDEIDDMHANVLEYLMGSADSQIDFEKNRVEFNQFMAGLKEATGEAEVVEEIEKLFNLYHNQTRIDVFSHYDPNEEAWAKQRVNALITYTGRELEDKLDNLKQSEIDDRGLSSILVKESYEDDLAGIRFYLELVDEAGDMVAALTQYINGDESAKKLFISDSQNFEYYLSQLKPYEKKPDEIIALKEVESLFRVLRDGGFEVMRRYNPAYKKKAITSINTINAQLFYRLETLLDQLALNATNTADRSLASMRNVISSSQYILSLLLLIVLSLCFLLTYLSYRTVLRPLSELTVLLKTLSAGEVQITPGYTQRKDEIGDIANAIKVFRDNLVARNKVEKELVKAKENAELASEAKANFVASMSHEIRTPMNGVIGLIELLASSSLNQNQLNMINTIQESANSLLNIINDILDFSKIEAGKLELNPMPFNLIKTIENTIDTLAVNADKSNVKIEVFTDPNLPESVLSDPVRIQQILFNIVGNAIKFSASEKKQGRVRLELNLLYLDDRKADIEIVITDNGIGIEEQQLSHLFTPFTQAESSITRRFGGTGLGLSISQTLVDLLGGNISVESTVGLGSSFKVNFSIIPLKQAFTFVPEKDIIILQTFESSWLSYCADKYLTAHKIPYRTVASFELKEQLNLIDPNLIVIRLTDQKGLDEIEGELVFDCKDKLNINYVVLDSSAQFESLLKEGVYLIGGFSSFKVTTLFHLINVILEKEALVELTSCFGVEEPLALAPKNIAEDHEFLILVAEDNVTNQQVIKRQLQTLGYNCILANDGVDAEFIYLEHSFDLVLTDCHMPNRDGYELTKVLRKIQKNSNHRVPIIAITADVIDETANKCRDAGMDDYISKPVKLVKLQGTLQKWLKPMSRTALLTAETQEEEIVLEQSVIDDIFDGNNMHYAASLNDFISYCIPSLNKILELKHSKIDEIKALAHQLKSSTKTIGAFAISECIETLEQACMEKDEMIIDTQLKQLKMQSNGFESTIRQQLKRLKL